jgi:hypothetical protein
LFPRTDKNSGPLGKSARSPIQPRDEHSSSRSFVSWKCLASCTTKRVILHARASERDRESTLVVAKLCFLEMPRKLHNTKRVILHARASERDRESTPARACICDPIQSSDSALWSFSVHVKVEAVAGRTASRL